MSTVAIHFFRHGRTALNLEGRYQGTTDAPLDPLGFQDARRVGVHLSTLIDCGERIHRMGYTSPLVRCRQTVDLALATAGLTIPFTPTPLLRERDCGLWEGLSKEQVENADPDAYRAYRDNKWTVAPPHGESLDSLHARVIQFLHTISGPTVMCGHQGVGWSLLVLLKGLSVQDALATRIPHGEIIYMGSA